MTILAIDDDPIYQYTLPITFDLTELKVELLAAVNGKEGLNALEKLILLNEGKIAILLDINMPIMNGWEFLKNFDLLNEKFKKNISIFIVSSSIDDVEIEKSRNNKYVQGFITKPLTPRKINKILDENSNDFILDLESI